MTGESPQNLMTFIETCNLAMVQLLMKLLYVRKARDDLSMSHPTHMEVWSAASNIKAERVHPKTKNQEKATDKLLPFGQYIISNLLQSKP